MKFLLLFSSLILAVLGQIFLKKGIMESSLSFSSLSILKTIFTPFVFGGFMAYGFSAIIWLFVLQKFQLSIAYSSLSLTYIIIAILSYYLFNEPLTIGKFVGMGFITLGVYVLFR